jgi:hypothetical protein
MDGGIFLLQENGELVDMTEQEYDSEDLLQGLLEKYPRLLPGEQIDSAAPRRWLLVSREVAVPSEEEGAARWSVDHLYLDQDAIPTLVEVKRSSDTRIRREVVGQMLDYAANAVLYWPVEQVRAKFEATCDGDPEEVIGEFLGPEAEPEEFWQRVKTNLQAGKIRLLFVADEIPSELRRIVEFLNAQMTQAEVLAVEIKQYVGQGLKTLVPRLYGQTAESEGTKGRGTRWDSDRFFARLRESSDPEEVSLAQELMVFGTEVSGRAVEWRTGRGRGSFTARLIVGDERFSLFSVYTTGEFSLNIGWAYERLAGMGLDLSEKYRAKANEKLSVDFARTPWERGWPMAKLSALVSDNAEAFKAVVREFVSEVRAALPAS